MNPTNVSQLFQEAALGNREAEAKLFDLVCQELRARAHLLMAKERSEHSFDTTDLVHETWLRLFSGNTRGRLAHSHFLRLAATAMRHVLVDHARRKAANKRGPSGNRIALDLAVEGLSRSGCDVVALHDSLDQLRSVDSQLGQLVELRFFGGATLVECAEAMDVALPTVERKWRLARIWLRAQLEP